MRCPSCKHRNPSHRDFCWVCGHDLKGKRWAVRLLIVALALVVLAIPVFLSMMDRLDRPPEPPPQSSE